MRSGLLKVVVVLVSLFVAGVALAQIKPSKPGAKPDPKKEPKKAAPILVTKLQARQFPCKLEKKSDGKYTVKVTNDGAYINEGGWGVQWEASGSGGKKETGYYSFEFIHFQAGVTLDMGTVDFDGTCFAYKTCYAPPGNDYKPCK